MGISKPADPHGTTAPNAWPDINEDELRALADAFDTVSRTVSSQLDAAQRQKAQMFAGVGIWSGGAAGAASKSLDAHISELSSLKSALADAVKFFNKSYDAVVNAKNKIVENVENANKAIDAINQDDKVEKKGDAIQAIVDMARNANAAIVASEAAFISGEKSLADGGTQESPHFIVSPAGFRGGHEDASDRGQSFATGGQGGSSGIVGGPGGDGTTSERDQSRKTGNEGGSDNIAGGSSAQDTSERNDTGDIGNQGGSANDTGNSGDGGPKLPPVTIPDIGGVPGHHVPSGGGPTISMSGGGAPGAPSVGAPGGGAPGAPSSPKMPGNLNPAAMTPQQQQLNDFTKAMSDAASKATQPLTQTGPSVNPTSAVSTPSSPLQAPPPAAAPPPPAAPAASASSSGGGSAPVNANVNLNSAPSSPMPLAAAPSVPAAGPSAPGGGSTGGPMGPGMVPTGTSQSGAGAVAPPPAPVPVSAARLERDAIAVSSTAAALQRKQAGNDPLAVARRIGAALNMKQSKDPGFYWITGLTKDDSIVVANTYGLGYIPDGIKLPESVKLASADESIPAGVRGSWATYPIVALHGWAQQHDTALRAVIATEDQFKGFDPGAAPIILQPDDIPESGQMQGRDRLTVISPDVSARLMKMSDAALMELLPPAQVDVEGPEDRRVELLLKVFEPLLQSDPGRRVVQLEAMVAYASHLQEVAVYRAHTASDRDAQRAAVSDWLYWQHLGVLNDDALADAVDPVGR